MHYCEYGVGSNIYIAFHGFGQDKFYFQPIAESLPINTKLISFDLPFHGKSNWLAGDSPINREDLSIAFKAFLQKFEITSFSVIGFSMGAKFALLLVKLFPSAIENFILIAPDGIKKSTWYRLATFPFFSRYFFKRTIVDPSIFKSLTQMAEKLKILDKSLLKFAKHQMNTRAKRRQVYFSWIVFRHLNVNISKLKTILNLFKIPTTVFLGSFDKMIDKPFITNYFKKVKSVEIIELESGHSQMLENVAKYYSTHPELVINRLKTS